MVDLFREQEGRKVRKREEERLGERKKSISDTGSETGRNLRLIRTQEKED